MSSVTATLKLDLKSLSHHIDFLAEKDRTMGSPDQSFPVSLTKYFHWLLKIKRFFIDLRTLEPHLVLLFSKFETESENADRHRTLHQRVTLGLLLFSLTEELLKTPDSIPTSTFFLSGYLLLLSLCFPRAS